MNEKTKSIWRDVFRVLFTLCLVYSVAFIFGNMSWISRIVYALVGLSGLYMLSSYGRLKSS